MEITLAIDGKQVPFRKSGATMLAYKRQTCREFFSDLSAFLGCVNKDKYGKIIMTADGVPSVDMGKFNVDYMYDILHVMAKAADKSIPSDVLEWLDGFDDFDVIGTFCKLLPMLSKEMTVDEKNSLTAAGKSQQTT